jgi:acetyl-CoA carboxylase biotin carboxylase subunit
MAAFRRVLVANRGEIALRIIRACHEEGLEAVAVYSEADRLSPHVQAADAAVALGPPAPGESYLRIDKLIAAARSTGAGAVHPGYGFLAERAPFASAVTEARLVFVGPPAAAIAAMGDKTEARRRMQAAGVPIVPGLTLPIQDPRAAAGAAEEIGYPILVKAAAGGGGKGMRVVHRAEDLDGALAMAASEAQKAFGDPSVYLERYVERPRHVEIQVLADHERTLHLGERECSIQRRHQKLVEEAPSAAVSPALRKRMGAAAVAAAEAVGYRSAGTCEFLLAEDGSFYFLEMNTRIQVEHPVTELVYGIDLVREQLRIAQGLPMQLPRALMTPRGWAMECRITSEDPGNGFLPSAGRIEYLRVPSGPGVRWDGGVEAGNEVTLFYDSLLGKVIVWGPDREEAIRRMTRALQELVITGVATNQGFHLRLLADADFRASRIDSQFLDRRPDLLQPASDDARLIELAVAAALAEAEIRQSRRAPVAEESGAISPWLRAARAEGLRP